MRKKNENRSTRIKKSEKKIKADYSQSQYNSNHNIQTTVEILLQSKSKGISLIQAKMVEIVYYKKHFWHLPARGVSDLVRYWRSTTKKYQKNI